MVRGPRRTLRFRSVQRSVGQIAAVLLTVCVYAGIPAASARAQITFAPCGDSNNYACGHVTVRLDSSGATPGTITLALRRHRAPVEGPSSAVIALAGGPGQAAVPFTEQFTELLGPIVSTRDLIVFDQRGTGLSHPLSCPAPKHSRTTPHVPGQAIVRCADVVGPSRVFYTTPNSVADIEAIRRAGGYEKLVLYGTSYGTKVAEQYAEDYPSHVEALVLDSVVVPNGPDPLNRSTFAAVPRILRQLCGHRECAHITPDPVSDLARLVGRMRRGALAGRVIDGHGHSHPEPIDSNDLVGILLEGDFDPLLRAEFIPAVRAAANGDTAALARLLARAESSAEGEEGGGRGEGIDIPLYLDTTCEEEAFPWSRAASPQARLAQATAQIDALRASVFTPFTPANALDFSDIHECAYWPFATPAPPVDAAPLPNVPTLILSGAADLRTPTANAQEVATQIPDSHLLVVPYGGHSVLTDEPTPCARDALQAMFAGTTIKPCRATPPPAVLRLPPLPPARIADVSPTHGYSGLPGRTLHAVTLTLGDFTRQFVLALLEGLGSGSFLRSPSLHGGGLRAGWYQFTGKALVFHGYSYVPGVTISGTVASKQLTLHIGGSAAAHGTLRLGAREALVGRLGGQRIHLAGHSQKIPATLARARPGLGGARDARTARLQALIGKAFDWLGTSLLSTPIQTDELQVLLSSCRYCRDPCAESSSPLWRLCCRQACSP
jgi:pimeloyl-ACP methyl ester carboxylesterase